MKKISSLLVVLLLMLASFTAGVEYERGDTNHDGVVNIADVTCLIDYLLNGTWPDDPVTPPDDHEWVDLGLPSGTLWATCNVGANSPEEYGDYFAWGETEPKDVYDWTTYKWCEGTDDTMTKYCSNSSFGIVDNKTELDPEDDAAYVNWGPSWRMPTHEQLQELAENCTWECSGASCKFTGPNGNTLYLPGAGYYYYDLFSGEGDGGIYWSRTIDPEYNNAFYLNFYMYGVSYDFTCRRMDGFTVRAVRVSQN